MNYKEALDILVGIAGYHAQYLDKEEIKEYNEALSHYEDITNGLEILEKHKQIEKELGIDLITLFSQKYKRSDDLEVEDKKTIYFVGDSYYGHWTKEEWLDFIKEVISAYRELVKLGR